MVLQFKKIIILVILLHLIIISQLKGQEGIDSTQLQLGNQLYQKANLIYNSNQDSSILLIKQAIIHYEKSKSWETYMGCLNTLVAVYFLKNEYQLYEEYSKKAVKEAEIRLSANHPQYALALNNRSSSFATLGNYDKAIESLKRSLEIYKNSNVDSLRVADSYHNIGGIFVKKRRLSRSTRILFQSIGFTSSYSDQSHPIKTFHQKSESNSSLKTFNMFF